MNAIAASTALGLLAAWPLGGLGWLLGTAADRLTGDPEPRARAWNTAVALPPAALGLMVGAACLPRETTDPIYQVVTSSPAVATVGAAVSEASARAMVSFNSVETAGAILILGALGGLAVAAARQGIGRAKLHRIVRAARPASTELASAVRAEARRLDTGRPRVLVSDEVQQPLLAGLSNPVILLPASLVETLDTARLIPICAHELVHLKRGDNWRLLAEHLLGGLFWMALPYAALRTRAAAVREELCDRLALADAPAQARRDYARTLVELLKVQATPALHPAFTGKGRKPTAMRLKAIVQPGRPADFLRRAALGLAGFAVLGAAGAGSLALAQQGDTGRTKSNTIITTSDRGKLISISSDYVRVKNAELVDGKVKVADGEMSTYHGNVEVRGRLIKPEVTVLLDGKAPPADFDATKLPKGAIDKVEMVNHTQGGDTRITLNVILAKSL